MKTVNLYLSSMEAQYGCQKTLSLPGQVAPLRINLKPGIRNQQRIMIKNARFYDGRGNTSIIPVCVRIFVNSGGKVKNRRPFSKARKIMCAVAAVWILLSTIYLFAPKKSSNTVSNSGVVGNQSGMYENSYNDSSIKSHPASDGLIYEMNKVNSGYVVTGSYEPIIGELIIPATYNGYPVTGVIGFDNYEGITAVYTGDNTMSVDAFDNCNGLAEVVFGSATTEIYGFQNCGSLKKVQLPDSVERVLAFTNCSSLEKVYIGESISDLNITFRSCGNIAYYDVAPNNQQYSSIDGNLVDVSSDRLVRGTVEGVLPPVTTIGTGAFYEMSVKNVYIPDTVHTIEADAFFNCNYLDKITYEGTCAQWNMINRQILRGYLVPGEQRWLSSEHIYEINIHCLDGEVRYLNATFSGGSDGLGASSYTLTFYPDGSVGYRLGPSDWGDGTYVYKNNKNSFEITLKDSARILYANVQDDILSLSGEGFDGEYFQRKDGNEVIRR